MLTNNVHRCKFCNSVITLNSFFGDTLICQTCGLSQTQTLQKSPKKIYILTFLLIIAVSFLFSYRNEILFFISPSSALSKMKEKEVLEIHSKCLNTNDQECLIYTYTRLVELDPTNLIYSSNLAFQLTKIKKFKEADLIYKSLIEKGEGTYDLLSYYGFNFQGLGKTDEAIKWFEKALEINPRLLDITESLAKEYVKNQRFYEAISLLESFINRFPDSKGALAGNLSVGMELLLKSKNTAIETIQLVGVNKGHFGMPITMGNLDGKSLKNMTEIFLVDTGATVVTIPTKDAIKYFPNQMREAKINPFILADGRVLDAYTITVPKLIFGNWEFKNVQVAYCENCERLAGMSLLKNMKMEINSRGEFYTLKLSRISR